MRLECSTFVNTARTVTPGIGTLLLSSTTPEIVVAVGSPGARPEAVNAAAKPSLKAKSASTRLFAFPSWTPSVSVAAARPSESVSTVTVGLPSKLPPPCFTAKVTGTRDRRLLPSSATTAMNGFGSGCPVAPI